MLQSNPFNETGSLSQETFDSLLCVCPRRAILIDDFSWSFSAACEPLESVPHSTGPAPPTCRGLRRAAGRSGRVSRRSAPRANGPLETTRSRCFGHSIQSVLLTPSVFLSRPECQTVKCQGEGDKTESETIAPKLVEVNVPPPPRDT